MEVLLTILIGTIRALKDGSEKMNDVRYKSFLAYVGIECQEQSLGVFARIDICWLFEILTKLSHFDITVSLQAENYKNLLHQTSKLDFFRCNGSPMVGLIELIEIHQNRAHLKSLIEFFARCLSCYLPRALLIFWSLHC